MNDKIQNSTIRKIKLVISGIIGSNRRYWYSFIYDVFIAIIAIFSVIPLITESQSNFIQTLEKLHWYFLSIFIFDYFLKWFLADVTYDRGRKSYLIYPFSFWAIVDFFAIIPAVIGLEIMQALLALRLLRLTRISPKLESGFKFIFRSIFTYWRVLIIIFITFTIIVFIGGVFLYVVEYDANPDINSYWDSVWFVFVTITTIGYGDIFPVTAWGRVFSIFFYTIGLCYLALVTATVVAGFQKQVKNFRQSVEKSSFYETNSYFSRLFAKKNESMKTQKSLIKIEPYYNLKEKFELSNDYIVLIDTKIDENSDYFMIFNEEKNDSDN